MLLEHLSYVSDTQRTHLFQQAVARTVRLTDHVLDLGCGVGIWGMLCLRAGAARVTALDKTAVTELASQTFARVEHGARVDIVQGVANRIALPEPVDLIICDHVGYFALDYRILGLLQDARARFLKPGGRILPAAVRLFLAPIGSEECANKAFAWTKPGIPQELHWIAGHAVNEKYAVSLKPEDVLGTFSDLGEIDFLVEERTFFSWKTEMTITRGGEMHGLGGWFDCRLCEGVAMTNSPLVSERINRHQALFPIEEPLQVAPGDVIRASLAMRPDESSFAWTVEHVPSGRRFRHGTLKSEVFNKSDLLRSRPDHVPVPTATARAGQIVMGYCDGKRTAAEIGAAVLADHPDLFPTPQAVTDFVAIWLGSQTE